MRKVTLLFALVFILAIGNVSAAWNSTLDAGLFGYYNCEDTNNVAGEISYNLTNKAGDPTFVDFGVSPGLGKSCEFDGNDGWEIQDQTQFNLTDNSEQFTISMWMFFNSSAVGQPILYKETTAYRTLIHNPSTSVIFLDTTSSPLLSTTTVPVGGWQLFFITRNSSSTCIWANTTLEQCQTNSAIGGSINNVTIGMDAARAAFMTGFLDELAFWNRTLTTGEIAQIYNSGAGITKQNITVTLNAPVNNSGELPSTNITFNISAEGSLNDLNNMTLIIDGIINETASLSGTSDQVLFGKSFIEGSYNWSAEVCNDDDECITSDTRFFTVSNISIDAENYSQSTFETKNETFNINITTTATTTALSAELFYNGISYTGTVVNNGGGSYTVSRKIDIPTITGAEQNNSFNWIFTRTDGMTTVENSTSNNQTVVNATLFHCSSGTPFANITFQDESNFSNVDGSIPTSEFNYYLGGGSIYKTLTYVNTTESHSHAFCFTPSTETLIFNATIQYESTNYPQRVFTDGGALNSTVTNRILYLLNTLDGIFVTIQVLNVAENPLSGVFANASRIILSNPVLVGSGTTGDDGGITFFLNPNFLHTFSFVASGLDQLTTSLFPSQSEFTVILGSSATVGQDLTKGIAYTIRPTGIQLDNETFYLFEYNLSSTFNTVDSWGFILRNSTDTLGTSTSSSNGGSVTLNFSTGNSSQIIMDFFWEIGGNYSNGSRSWVVVNTGNTDWSIKNFFEDLSSFANEGIFGLDNFGLAILSFLFIFIFTGIMSTRFGITSPVTITALIFSLVLFLDVGVGLIPAPPNTATNLHFPTIFMAIVLIGIIYKEGTR